ncbi:unnamed protein product [Prunus brigantina]
MPSYRPDQGKLEDKAPFSRSDLEYLRQYFTVTPADTIFSPTTEERAQVSRLDDYLMARDALAKARRALEEEVEASDSPKIKGSTDGTPGTARRMVEVPGDPFFGHEVEDDPTLGISNEEYEGILGMVEQKTLARGGCKVEEEAGGGNQREPKEVIPRDEPNKYRYLKPLYISAHVEGVPVSKVFVDCGATVNILPYSLMKKLDNSKAGLIPSDVVMSSFVGDKSKPIGVLPVSIHTADEKPFETNAVQARIYDDNVGWVVLTGDDASGRPTRTTTQKVLKLGAENVRQDLASEVLIDLTSL